MRADGNSPGLKSAHEARMHDSKDRPEESVLIKDVSLFQRLKCTQALYLGRENVSCLERCP